MIKKKRITYYAKCIKCRMFDEKATTLEEAQAKIEEHEKKKHGGKQVGSFGIRETT